MKLALPTVYNPQATENKWYRFWLDKGFFAPDTSSTASPFCIVIPPPNVTGSLHIGHALNNTLQDILVRARRMQGRNTLWVFGTDHAGIATQNVVEKQLALKGLSRNDLGREGFVKRVWKWKEESGNTIIGQLKKLGVSCDWSRERFTMDEGLSRAVQQVFIRLYNEGLIYRGNYIINWCPRCHTALSDLEVEYHQVDGQLYYLKYPLAAGPGYMTVATTRPETMLGDTAVAVHPTDSRFTQLVGQEVILPIVGRRLPIIADSFVDPEFGTGSVKITPAHDPHDFEVGLRHQLPQVAVMNPEATMNDQAGKYAGLDRFQCRHNILEELKAGGYIERIEDYQHAVGHCYRCKTIIEPTVSEQWFLKMKPLAEPAIEAVKKGEVKLIPKQWENTYYDWMNNIRDWCISRQIWWGHRIPIWYCQGCNEVIAAVEQPKECHKCGSKQLTPEMDVLDTWFSSALWPFSTLDWLDWPESELKKFYPTSVLVTGFDILFFWVARMIMMGLKFTGDVPFHEVYIHALVRDAKGAKMSKSKGNVIDPLETMESYGTDAFRFTLTALTSQGRDICLSEKTIEGYRNFMNKIWNASRFCLMNIEDYAEPANPGKLPLELADHWIIWRLEETAKKVTKSLEEYRFNDAAMGLYHFFWYEFCDWYLELAKLRLRPNSEQEGRLTAQYVMLNCLETTLRLLHPFIPFITEEIWQALPRRKHPFLRAKIQTGSSKKEWRRWPDADKSIMKSPWPSPDENEPISADWNSIFPFSHNNIILSDMLVIKDIITRIRTLRSDLGLAPNQKMRLYLKPDSRFEKVLNEYQKYIVHLAGITELMIDPNLSRPPGTIASVVADVDIFLQLEGVDFTTVRQHLKQKIIKVQQEMLPTEKKLGNQAFLQKAPAEVVEEQRRRLAKFQHELEHLQMSQNSIQEP